MSDLYQGNSGAVVEATLASAVADAGTFTVNYPTGFTQDDFLHGLAGTGSYAIVNYNDKWTLAASKIALDFSNASYITVTNNSSVSWAAGSNVRLFLDIQDGSDVILMAFPLPAFSAIANGDVVTDIYPGVAGTLEWAAVVVTTAVTTAAKAATLNFEIGTTNCTGGTIAMTSAALTPIGKMVESTAFTGANTLTRSSKLSVEASSVTAFVEGAGYLLLRIRRTRAAYAGSAA